MEAQRYRPMLGGPLLLSEPCRCDFKHCQSPLSSLYSLPCGSASLLGIPPGCLDLCGRGRLVWTDSRECVGTHRTPCLRHNPIRHPLPPRAQPLLTETGALEGLQSPILQGKRAFHRYPQLHGIRDRGWGRGGQRDSGWGSPEGDQRFSTEGNICDEF